MQYCYDDTHFVGTRLVIPASGLPVPGCPLGPGMACSVDFFVVVSSRGFADARSIRCASPSRGVAVFVVDTRRERLRGG